MYFQHYTLFLTNIFDIPLIVYRWIFYLTVASTFERKITNTADLDRVCFESVYLSITLYDTSGFLFHSFFPLTPPLTPTHPTKIPFSHNYSDSYKISTHCQSTLLPNPNPSSPPFSHANPTTHPTPMEKLPHLNWGFTPPSHFMRRRNQTGKAVDVEVLNDGMGM